MVATSNIIDSANPAQEDKWLTAKQAASYLRLSSEKAVYERVRRGQIPAFRFGRYYRFRVSDLDALVRPVH